ncbi:MAG: hypothetical protein AAGC57_06425 [Pseudomonadota bacterium]
MGRLLDDAPTFVDDADVGLVERDFETYEELHSLTSLIGCDAADGPDVDNWCKARSAHLYRQVFAQFDKTERKRLMDTLFGAAEGLPGLVPAPDAETVWPRQEARIAEILRGVRNG